ncbi:hypothetical protein [Parasitella parasitica]|uniref:Uncharacterized protein n=1 Tax=Parasitella parasitica TaxID=35722 RepID=A0A0B7NK23_9FUNG|nr:hypothetical protein [Parasitella parasitica]
MVYAEDVQNIYKKIQEAAYIRHPNVQESIKIWLNEELQEMGFYTYLDASFSATFSFGFMSPWQARLLVVSTCICLDATHCVANVENGILYTIVVRHPLTESWHNQLESNYLQRKSNRRVDRLMWILVNDVEYDFRLNIDRIRLNIGRMGPAERRRRQREMKAEAINEIVMTTMIKELESTEKRKRSLRKSDYVLDLAPYPISTQVDNEEVEIRSNASFDDIMDKLASILATCRVSRPINVSEGEINEL